MKRGDNNRTFQRRWCVLKGNLLYYYERQSDREPLGSLVLEGCRVELADDEDQLFAFKIVFAGPNARQYIFGTDSQLEMESWIKCLSTASLDFLKTTISEKQTQLDTLQSRQKQLEKMIDPFEFDPLRQNLPTASQENKFEDDFVLDGDSFNLPAPALHSLKTPFCELHRYYGEQFKKYFNNPNNRIQHPTRPPRRPQPSSSASTGATTAQNSSNTDLLIQL